MKNPQTLLTLRPPGKQHVMSTDSSETPPPKAPAHPEHEIPGGPAATPPTPEGREAVLEEGEEA
jgi:hypothetical protein